MIYDKRTLKRYDIFLIVEFKPLNSSGGFSIGITRDLSPDGFSLEAQTIECQRGDIIEFRLKHPDADWTVDISGEVAWKNHSWYKYIIGIKFLHITSDQNLKIRKLMSAVMDAVDKPGLIGKDSESLLETEKEKMPDAELGSGAIDNSILNTRITKINPVSLKEAEHCELTGTERTFIAGDVFGTGSGNGEKEIKPARGNNNLVNRFKETLINDNELHPETAQMAVDSKTADRTAHTDIKARADSDNKKIYSTSFNSTSRRATAQVPYLYNTDSLENNRKKILWLYVPLVTVVIFISVLSLPVIKKIFNHASNDFIPVSSESTANNTVANDRNESDTYNVQMSSKDFDGPSGPSPVRQAEAKNASTPENDKTVNAQQASAREDSSGILHPKSDFVTEVKSKRSDAALPVEKDKTVNNTSQMNNANIFRPEINTGAKPLRDNIEKGGKIDLVAKIEETLKNLRAIQNERPSETEVVIDSEKTAEAKPLAKTEEQAVTPQIVKLEETPAPASATESERNPAVEQEVKASEEKNEGIKKTRPADKIRDIPNVALLVKRDNPRNIQTNSSYNTAVTTADLIKKWKYIGNTKGGVPLFINPDNISYPSQHVVNLLVKASVNKTAFIDVLAINCSQIKLRILEERNGNNPVFSSYSNEWKDIIPDSMILYNFACPEKK